jgi:tetratricopeptide (TPR) repeat protein
MDVAVSDAILERELASLDAGADAGTIVATASEGAAEALFGLAAALGRDGEERLSLFYTRIASWLRPEFNDASLLAAELLQEEGQYDLAIEAFEDIPLTSALSRAAEIGRAESLRLKGMENEAAEALRALVRREPDAIDAHIALGDLLRRGEKWVESVSSYDAAIDLMDEAGRPNWVLFYERGISHERSDQWDLAEADFFRALELKEDQPLVLNYLGYSWLEKGLHLDRALEMIRKAVDQRPTDGYIVDSLGWAYYLLEDYPNAVLELERAVELRPVDPVINDHFGDALWKVGRKREAAFQWRRSLSFEPEDDDAALTRRKIEVGLDVVEAEVAARKAATGEPTSAAKNDG